MRFKGNFLQWRIARHARTYRVYVVEPDEYRPEQHGDVFGAALTALIAPTLQPVDPFAQSQAPASFDHFDLVTFPEAFLPKDELISILGTLRALDSIGCVHVGLRPGLDASQHLFQRSELMQFTESLASLPNIEPADWAPFSAWLQGRRGDEFFNVGCLFTIDADRKLRVCLHPKLIRSRFEASPLHEHHMTEADLLTLVTLLPSDKALLSITLQPLLCSDVLQLGTDRPHARPLEAVNTDAECLGSTPPDHIDIVSVATCSPQPQSQISKGELLRSWHSEFRDSFKRAASDDSLLRHHYAIFVLANFRTMGDSTPGGLSGVFLPQPIGNVTFPDFVKMSCYGRAKGIEGAENEWSPPGDAQTAKGISSLGHIAFLDPFAHISSQTDRMFGLTVNRLPRDTTRWKHTDGLTDFQILVANHDSALRKLTFKSPGGTDE